MKHSLCALAVLGMVIVNHAAETGTWADSKTGITWVYTVRDGKTWIESSYGGAAIDSGIAGSIVVPDTLFNTLRVTGIGRYAFRSCTKLTSVTIPSAVTVIGDYAFYRCSGLMSMTIPFAVTSIGDSAFCGCSKLSKIEIPSNVMSIGAHCFSDCGELVEIVVDDDNRIYGSHEGILYNKANHELICCPAGKDGSVDVQEDVTSIADSAFSGCACLTAVTIPESVKSIGNNAFLNCSGLTSLTIPEGVTSIGDCVFWGCEGLTSVTIPNGVTNVGVSAFVGCSGLISVTIPVTVADIGPNAFQGCRHISSLVVPSWVPVASIFPESKLTISHVMLVERGVVPAFAYRGCSAINRVDVSSMEEWLSLQFADKEANPLHLGADLYVGQKEVSELVIPEGTTEIGAYAFAGGRFISVTIPNSVTKIDPTAFAGCSNITSVVLGASLGGLSSVASIFPSSFAGIKSLTISGGLRVLDATLLSGCEGLEKLVLPESVKRICVGALDDCSLLRSVTLPSQLEDFGLELIPEAQRRSMGLQYDANGFMLWNGWLLDCENREVAELIIPQEVVGIGHYALSDMADLEKVLLPMSLVYITDKAFANDTYLDEVVLPDSVEVIGEGAFENCSWMQTMTMGAGIVGPGPDGVSCFSR